MSNAELSRIISYALRHEPWVFEIELDNDGWVPLSVLVAAIRTSDKKWQNLSEDEVRDMISASEKKRHEILEGRIRALYGHSTPKKLSKERIDPPECLYHGTAPATAQTILRDALRPMARQYVHLSTDLDTAMKVGERKAQCPVILRVNALEAARRGVDFYRGNDRVVLADYVPAEFIEIFEGRG